MSTDSYDPKKRFCKLIDNVSRTIQDAIVDIPTLLRQFGGRLDDLFDKYNNGLLYESTLGTGIFIDELNKDEVAKYNQFLKAKAEREANEAHEAELFEQYKQEIAARVAQSRETPPASTPVSTPTSASASSSVTKSES